MVKSKFMCYDCVSKAGDSPCILEVVTIFDSNSPTICPFSSYEGDNKKAKFKLIKSEATWTGIKGRGERDT